MIGRLVDVSEANRYLHVYRGFLCVSTWEERQKKEIGRMALDDIEAVLIHGHGIIYTHNVMQACAKRGIPFVLCGQNHHPQAILMPFAGHHQQAARFEAQCLAKRPLKKRLWAQLIQSKLQQQAANLSALGLVSEPLYRLSCQVKAGDPDNLEAQGARYYWKMLFGSLFKRHADQPDFPNILLNYGYTVLRSAVARAVCAAGLHPTLAVFHRNQNNAMRLVDDLIEPFRPVVDQTVYMVLKNHGNQGVMTPLFKKELVKSLYRDMTTPWGVSPVGECIYHLAQSLAHVYLGEKKALMLPDASVESFRSCYEKTRTVNLLSGYRLMWMVVMFDLPVLTKMERKGANDFRLRLLDMGYERAQLSVYVRRCSGWSQFYRYAREIENVLPEGGQVDILHFSDKQYEKIISYHQAKRKRARKNPDQLVLF